MTYAFQTPEKLCFILDLMNGGDLHYHLSQHGVFLEKEVRFYAAEVILGLEHMHSRFVVYRDLKVSGLFLHLRYSKTCVKRPLTKISMTNGSLMKVKNIAECSILQYF